MVLTPTPPFRTSKRAGEPQKEVTSYDYDYEEVARKCMESPAVRKETETTTIRIEQETIGKMFFLGTRRLFMRNMNESSFFFAQQNPSLVEKPISQTAN